MPPLERLELGRRLVRRLDIRRRLPGPPAVRAPLPLDAVQPDGLTLRHLRLALRLRRDAPRVLRAELLQLCVWNLDRLRAKHDLLNLVQGLALALVPLVVVRREQIRELLVRVKVAQRLLRRRRAARAGLPRRVEHRRSRRELGGAKRGRLRLHGGEVLLRHAVALQVSRDGDFASQERGFLSRRVQTARVGVRERVVLAVLVVQLEHEVERPSARALRGLHVAVSSVVHEGSVALEGLELLRRFFICLHHVVVVRNLVLLVDDVSVHLVVGVHAGVRGAALRRGGGFPALHARARLAFRERQRVVVGDDAVAGVLGQRHGTADGDLRLGGVRRGGVLGGRGRRRVRHLRVGHVVGRDDAVDGTTLKVACLEVGGGKPLRARVPSAAARSIGIGGEGSSRRSSRGGTRVGRDVRGRFCLQIGHRSFETNLGKAHRHSSFKFFENGASQPPSGRGRSVDQT